MCSCTTNRRQTPTIDLDIIYPQDATDAFDDWTGVYSKDSAPTRSHYDTHDGILHFIDSVRNDQAYADRIRFIGITFVSDTACTRAFGRRIAAVLPLLRNIDSLRLEECFEHDFGILSSPAHFPHLTSLTCDIPPSAEFESFLAANPTITKLFCGGSVDMNDYVGAGRTLPPEILPNLTVIECDIFLMGYYIPYHPVVEVIPRQVIDTIEPRMEKEFASLCMSTAGGGIQAGGGVTTFHLGHNYSLDRLAYVVPNLVRLYLYNEENDMLSFSDSRPSNDFWTTSGWEQCLGMFRCLREVNMRTDRPPTQDEQKNLIVRWANSHLTLDKITFESNPPLAVEETMMSLPELVHGGSDYDESDSDVMIANGREVGHGRAKTICSKWLWNYEVGSWFVA